MTPFTAEIYTNQWVDITSDVREDAFNLSLGQTNETGQATAGTCGFRLKNTSGTYSPRNPGSPYYGLIGRNTPFRITQDWATDTFTRSVSNGWGSADTGQAWTIAGAGGTVQASDWQVAAGAGTMSVPVANATRVSRLAVELRNMQVTAQFSLPFTNISGNNIKLGVELRRTTNGYYLVRAILDSATDTITGLEVLHSSSGAAFGVSTSDPIAFTGFCTVKAEIDGYTIRGKVWSTGFPEPDWQLVAGSSLETAVGGTGVQAFVSTGNTNTKPVVVSVDNVTVTESLYHGEIPAWPPQRDTTGRDSTMTLEASGILRRLSQGSPPTLSALQRFILSNDPFSYWPMDDKAGATTARNAADHTKPLTVENVTPDWSSRAPAAWLETGVKHTRTITSALAAGTRFVGNISMPINVTGWAVDIVFTATAGSSSLADDFQIGTDFAGIANEWQLSVGGGEIAVGTPWSAGALTSLSGQFDDSMHHVRLWPRQAAGNVTWNVYLDGVSVLSGTELGRTMTPISREITLGAFTVLNGGTLTTSHMVVWLGDPPSISDTMDAVRGYDQEPAGERLQRLVEGEGIRFFPAGNMTDTQLMGPQPMSTLLGAVQECVDADCGVLFEPRADLGLGYRPVRATYNADPTVTLTWDQLRTVPTCTDDDLNTRNKVTVSHSDEGSFTAAQFGGPLNVAAPPEGVGEYGTEVTVNAASDHQLPDLAGWLLRLGTVDEPRYPAITVELAHSQWTAAQRAALSTLSSRDKIVITGSPLQPDDITLLWLGVRETLNATLHTLVIYAAPASPYEVWELEHATLGRLHTGGSVVASDATSTATTLKIANSDGVGWSTAEPYDILVSGEQVTATTVTDETFTFVAAGTAAHADNAPVTPGLPTGLSAGNLLLAAVANRNFNAGIGTPLGWTEIANMGNLRLFGKVASSSETAPTFVFLASSAGDTCSAQLAAFSGGVYDPASILYRWQWQINATLAQDIAYPGMDIAHSNRLVLYIGWKQDDWTSVATIAGATEIGEPASVLGNDHGLVWGYLIQTTPASIPAGTFTVTGGATAFSIGAIIVLRCDRQSFTVTRSVNGVVKAQVAGNPVSLPTRHAIRL